ncbi:MAG: 4-(cytidine 5'-diphospho)-2-C-methyl-D-erythritol kinase [bacterium]
MVVFPNAKINLGLHITAKRADGYHDIETLYYPISLRDALEIIPAPDGRFQFSSTGLEIPGHPGSNLCIRAFEILSGDFDLPPVHIYLHKVIPIGAGLGGGSSDGAFAVGLLNNLFTLGLSAETMKEYTLNLGSDCPFFIENKPLFGSGRGDRFEPAPVDLSGYFIMVVVPGVHVPTAEAYAGVTPHKSAVSLRVVLDQAMSTWKENLVNDFESSVIQKHPIIGEIKNRLYRSGALYASMSGSGSAVYGLFKEIPELKERFPGCFTFVTRDA